MRHIHNTKPEGKPIMATATLTDRQQQIKKLLDQGKTPKQIAAKLKISENAVYQQLRRIRAANGEPARRASKPRKPTSKRGRPQRLPEALKELSRVDEPTPVAAQTMTPLQAVRLRRKEIETQLKESGGRVDAARKAFEGENEAHDKLVATRKEELSQLEKAEAALTGKPVTRAAKGRPRRAAATNGAQAAVEQAPAAPAPETAPESPVESTQVAEPPAVEEERPGVPTVEEFGGV